jgi:single-stranded-DNA-specific exonuclease
VWGQGFTPPIFYDRFEVVNQRLLAEKHLKLSLKKEGVAAIDAIYFNHATFFDGPINVAYQLQTNSYNGTQKVQLNIKLVG